MTLLTIESETNAPTTTSWFVPGVKVQVLWLIAPELMTTLQVIWLSVVERSYYAAKVAVMVSVVLSGYAVTSIGL